MKLIVICFLAVLSVGSCQFSKRDADDDQENMNALCDMIIDGIRDDLESKNQSFYELPDIKKNFETKVIGIKISVELDLKHGKIGNLSSIARMSPALVIQDDDTGNVTISTLVGLKTVQLKYEAIDVQLPVMTIHGPLTAECGENSFGFSVSAITDKEGSCKAVLNWARVESLGKFNIQFGSGFSNWIKGKILTYGLDAFSSIAKKQINSQLETLLSEYMDKISDHICNPF